jgi:hypothetical protein
MVEITTENTFDPTIVVEQLSTVVGELNKSKGLFVLLTEALPDGSHAPVALATRKITRIRDKKAVDGVGAG